MRQKEVNERWTVLQQALITRERVHLCVNDTKHTGIDICVFGLGKQSECTIHRGEAGSAVRVMAMSRSYAAATVDAYAYGDPGRAKRGQCFSCKQNRVGLHGHPDGASRRHGRTNRACDSGQGLPAREKGFPAVQDDPYGTEVVPLYVFGYTLGGGAPDRCAHQGRAVSPALVGLRVHIAVVASKVAPLRDFEHEFP
ncbi:MAG TPA: hypothetical protein VFC19_45410 [Candidatus Limnocylindrales bacterium]|nr:hypothetical protein [Candidatus Limnocylindrales bacterium]